MHEKAIIRFRIAESGHETDLEIPLNITAAELITALNMAFHLGISEDRLAEAYLKTENPAALLKGNRLLSESGIYNGTIIIHEGKAGYEPAL